MFTFVLTTPDGKKALEDIVYSPTQTKNPDEVLTLTAPEDEVHITAPTLPATHAAYYTLAGQRIASPKQTGIYIKGSRKVVV